MKPPSTLNLGLAHAAVRTLAPELWVEIRDRFRAFAEGMPKRSQSLGDEPRDFDHESWERRHVWLCIHAQNESTLTDRVGTLSQLAREHGLGLDNPGPYGQAVVDHINGKLVWREHFGFRDAISNPALADWPATPVEDPDKYFAGRGKYVNGRWVGLATGEFLLGYVNEADEQTLAGLSAEAQRLLKHATFGVLRKLRQDVRAFRQYLQSAATTEANPDYLAARMVGRNKDGVPVGAPDAEGMQRFTYLEDTQGARCPLGAHTRRANPRESGRHRLFRRGIPYGTPYLDHTGPDTTERGLWFVAFNASIESQFE